MAVNKIWWATGEDIHLVAGATCPRLDGRLAIGHGNPQQDSWASTAIAGVTVRFRAAFAGALAGNVFSGHGISVDQTTGAVTVANPLPAPPRLRNFLIHAEVTDTSVAPAAMFVKRIRVHIHAAVAHRWLTPAPLTIRQGADGQSLSLYAQFDDDVIGDLTALPGLAWVSATPASVAVDPATGALRPLAPGANVDITVTLPAPYAGNATTKVQTLPPWGNAPATKLIPGSAGAARMNDPMVPNFLFLPDGFKAGERAEFEQTVLKLVRFLRRSPAAQPFGLCSAQMNFWMAWIESRETGTSPLYAVVPTPRDAKMFGASVPWPEPPDAAAGIWTLPQLIHEVGLPVAAQGAAAVTLAAQQAEWAALFGAGVAAHVEATLHAQWKALALHRIVNERDTALGLALGKKPSAELTTDDRSLSWHPRRTTRAHLDVMLTSMRDAAAPAAAAIGGVWGAAAGKDRSLVIALCAGAPRSGARSAGPHELIAMGLVLPAELQLVPGPVGLSLQTSPFSVPAHPSLDAACTVAHESAHALTLGDEYGGRGTLPAASAAEARRYPNLQDATSAAAAPGPGLDPSRLKWNWPRIVKAGVLDGPPAAEPGQPGSYRLALLAGHTAPFVQGDFVRLRTRPIADAITSVLLQVMDVQIGDELVVAGPGFQPDDFDAGSIVFVQRESATGVELRLISPTVHAHLQANRIPLNSGAASAAAHVCSPDPSPVQRARNRPAALPNGRPKFSSWIVGAFEGGMGYDCGIYHPTGACMMRLLVLPETVAKSEFGKKEVAYLFCPVCRYILVDRLDPTQHGVIDDDYEKRYAEP